MIETSTENCSRVRPSPRAQFFRETGFANESGSLIEGLSPRVAQQKSSSVPLLPENGRYRLSMTSD
jgi:hypothetical protein